MSHGVKEDVLVEVTHVVMPVRASPNEQIGPSSGAADDEVGIAGVIRAEIEAEHPVGARRHAAILDLVTVGRKLRPVDREVTNAGCEVRAHLRLSRVIHWGVGACPVTSAAYRWRDWSCKSANQSLGIRRLRRVEGI